MDDFQFSEQDKIKKDIDLHYKDFINNLMVIRLRIIGAISIALHLAFWGVDLISYKNLALLFFKIRLFDAFLIFILIILTFLPKLKSITVWLTDIGSSILVLGVAVMAYIADGSSCRYYEGANLVIIGVSIINPFYLRHLVFCYLLWLISFNIAMIWGHGPFNGLNFTFANYFMFSTSLLITITTKFYKDQHYKAFVRQEQLKINEDTLAALYNQADKLSKTDTLTEINNRRHFSDMLNKKIEISEDSETPFYLIIFDVDRFKNINDTYGHTFGDKVLVKVVEIVKNNIRNRDFIGRFGGDEFVICLDTPDKESTLNRLIKIRDGVRSLRLAYQDKEVSISVSIGAAKFVPGTKMTEEILMEKADFELFNVKNTTRGDISINM